MIAPAACMALKRVTKPAGPPAPAMGVTKPRGEKGEKGVRGEKSVGEHRRLEISALPEPGPPLPPIAGTPNAAAAAAEEGDTPSPCLRSWAAGVCMPP
jgi:hypothetical protein